MDFGIIAQRKKGRFRRKAKERLKSGKYRKKEITEREDKHKVVEEYIGAIDITQKKRHTVCIYTIYAVTYR